MINMQNMIAHTESGRQQMLALQMLNTEFGLADFGDSVEAKESRSVHKVFPIWVG